jgi:hypothetical protein
MKGTAETRSGPDPLSSQCPHVPPEKDKGTTLDSREDPPAYSEMKFLTKDSSLFLHAIHSPFYRRILKRTILYSGFNNPYKKSARQDKLKSIHEQHFVERKTEGRKPDKNSSLRSLEFMPRNLN